MKKILVLSVLSLVFHAFPIKASTEKEKVELARIANELNYLKEDVLQISKLRRIDDFEAFNYEALLKDLESVRSAVERHINEPSRQPKKLKPLEAEYGNVH